MAEKKEKLRGEESNKEEGIIERSPVVVVLGHIDHGKSSLLEAIRDLKITEKETGGITQHIGAYAIEHEGKKITFIDTPGHEAFSAMRSRGAKVADIAILVVAADEGVKPQTKEAIFHIKEAKIPLIVAINKMDKPTADPRRVKQELAKNDVLAEEMGGEVPMVEVSAKDKTGIEDLLKLILLIAEMEELKGSQSGLVEGTIIESYSDAQRGPTCTLILANGTLKIGDIIATPSAFGKVKRMEDFQGNDLQRALLSMPVIVLGFKNVPGIGEQVRVYLDTEAAIAEIKRSEERGGQDKKIEKQTDKTSEESDKKILNIILKTDFSGLVEPIEHVLSVLPRDKVLINILKTGVGDINLSDVKLARSVNAFILGFRVKIDARVFDLAKKQRVRVLNFDLIYDLVEGVRKSMERSLTPEKVRVDLAQMEVLAIFKSEGKRQVVGGKVLKGEFSKGAQLEILRKKEVIGKGRVIEIQRNKRVIKKAKERDEVGILYEGGTKINQGDILKVYKEEERASVL